MKTVNPQIFKAYDIRGVYGEDIDEEIAYSIAQSYAKFMNFSGGESVVVGRDVRLSGKALGDAVVRGLIEHGINVVDIGVVSTDMMYFAVVDGGYDGGLQITASHNPAQYNGVKMVRKRAAPISGDSGIYSIRDLVMSGYHHRSEKAGSVSQAEVSGKYLDKILSIIDVSHLRPLRVVANCNFGAIGPNLDQLANRVPITFSYLNREQDGNFPKGRPDPLIPENRSETIAMIRSDHPDFAAAWDADADRIFFFDETGRFLSGYFTTAVLAEYMLGRYPGSKVLVDSKLNWATADTVRRLGGETLTSKTGHSFYKERMIAEDAAFGGEMSAHYFFKDFYYLDNGLLPLLIIASMVSNSGRRLSEIYQPYFDKYFAIEETNLTVADVPAALARLKNRYHDGRISELDGVAIEYSDWRFSVRSSNTEPLVRLNLEARSRETMQAKAAEVATVILGK